MTIASAAVGLAVAFVAAAAVMPSAHADPVVKETFDYYDIDGTTAADVRADLNRRGPLDSNEHRRFDAVTRWHVRWHFSFKTVAGNCAIATASTSVDVTYAFPRFSPDSSAPVALRQAFAQYSERLMVHEKGHAQTAIDIASRIEDGIRNLPPTSTCARLGEIADGVGHALIKEANRIDIDYDARTEHGKTQGARFP